MRRNLPLSPPRRKTETAARIDRDSSRAIDRLGRIATLVRVLTLEHSPVHSDPQLMGGTLVFRGSRVPAQTLLDYLDDGFSLGEFIEMFPSVSREDAVEFLRLARGPGDEHHSGRKPAEAA